MSIDGTPAGWPFDSVQEWALSSMRSTPSRAIIWASSPTIVTGIGNHPKKTGKNGARCRMLNSKTNIFIMTELRTTSNNNITIKMMYRANLKHRQMLYVRLGLSRVETNIRTLGNRRVY